MSYDPTKTYPNRGPRGVSSRQSIEMTLDNEGGYYDSIKPDWCDKLRFNVVVSPSAHQLRRLLAEMPDIFEDVEPE